MIEKPEEIFVGLVAQKVIIEQAGKILCVRTKLDAGKWDLPGGRLHLNEEPIAGLEREVYEEIGCNCEVHDVVSVNQFYHAAADKPCVFIAYHATLQSDYTIQIPDDELEGFTWLPIAECTPAIVYENCCVAIENYSKKKL